MRGPVVILGSGFAGTILARALLARGRDVRLIERYRHPRFALGESSTPLAAICLERLASTYGLPDLAALAAYGRWTEELPRVGRGLKRGFSFYGHRRDRPYENGPENEARMLVAASPDDEIADAHWLRADVDEHLVRRAVAEGVEYIDRCEITSIRRGDGGWRLRGTRAGRTVAIDAGFVVDATGGTALLARAIGLSERPSGGPRTGLVFGHFDSVPPFVDVATGATFDGAPYPEERAAVHHLLEEGWMYVLPFDDGRVSAGFVLDRDHPDAARFLSQAAEASWREMLARYPTLDAQFREARPLRPLGTTPALPRRLETAAGQGWALLPHTFAFVSPMFSTGIAWSLIAVERLARLLTTGAPAPRDLATYSALLEVEADHLARLVTPGYRHRHDFERFAAWTAVYFAAASFQEASERLCAPPEPGEWSSAGLLGARDPVIRRALEGARRDLDRRPEGGERTHWAERAVGRWIAPRNLAGLADPARHRMYPVNLEALVDAASLLELGRDEMRARLPRLRGLATETGAR